MKYLPITLFLLILNVQANSQGNWSNYVNERHIYDIEVDGNDVWIGSEGGLTKTNLATGEIKTFLASNSPIIGGGITEIEQAPDGSFWFGSVNAGIFHYKNGDWKNYFDGIIKAHDHKISNLRILPNGDVWFFVDEGFQKNRLFRIREGIVELFENIPDQQLSFCATDENTIYIAYHQAIYKYDVGQKAVVETLDANNSIISEDDKFSEIVADKNGAVIISSPTRILKLKDGNLTILEELGAYLISTFQDDDGNIFLQPFHSNPNQFRLIKYDGNEVTYYMDEDFEPYPVERTPVFTGVDSEGGLYGVLYNLESEFNVYRFANEVWTPVRSQIFPIIDNQLKDVQSDCNGNLWFIGGHSGVDVKYADGTWEHFSIEIDQFGSFSADDMTVDPITCDIWLSNGGSFGVSTIPGIVRISNGEYTEFLYNEAIITDIEATVDGKVYFYSTSRGFGYIENDEINFIDEFDEYGAIYSLDSDSKGNIYLVDLNLGLIKYDGQNFDYLGFVEGGNNAEIVLIDNDDFIWLTTSNGLMQFDGNNWNSYIDTWPNGTLNDLVQDKKGNFWISTWYDGLYYGDKDNVQNYNIFNSGLSTNKLRKVSLDLQGNLIVTQNVGASVLSIPNNQRNYKGSGTVFYDSDKNGLFEEGSDILVPGQKVRAAELNVWSITNPNGKYSFYSNEPIDESFEYLLEENTESTTDNPQLASIINNNSVLPNFGFWKELEEDVDITISNGVPVCNRDFKVYINLRNQSVGEVSGNLILKHDDFLTILDSSFPISQQSDDEIIFDIISIGSLSGKGIQLTFEAPGIEVDETSITFDATFETLNQFSDSTTDIVRCSYDPNDKKVEATGDFKNDFGLIKDPIKYTIRFQNEGTYKAFDITVIDTLDSNLDPATFELLASSHRVETTISEAGVVNFIFPNIDLPPKDEDDLGSQGFVSFTVKPYSDTENFVKIHNTASIYFDFNPPIVTNTTEWNVVDNLSLVGTHEVVNRVQVYPNPSDGFFKINLAEESLYRIMDVSGKLVDQGNFTFGLNTIEINVNPGVYMLQVNGTSGVLETKKLVVF